MEYEEVVVEEEEVDYEDEEDAEGMAESPRGGAASPRTHHRRRHTRLAPQGPRPLRSTQTASYRRTEQGPGQRH